MPLVITVKDHQLCPTIICDICEEEIKTASEGMYEWVSAAAFEEANPEGRGRAPMYFAHIGTCSMTSKSRGRGSCISLLALPAYLLRNLGCSLEESEETAKCMSGFVD